MNCRYNYCKTRIQHPVTSIVTMCDETSCRDDQIPCGNIVVNKKIAKNGEAYLEFFRKQVRICIFKEEWINFKGSKTDVENKQIVKMSNEKTLQPDTWQNCNIVWVQLSGGFKFFMSWSDYCQVICNAEYIDELLGLTENTERLYYSWEAFDPYLQGMRWSAVFFKNESACREDGEREMCDVIVRVVQQDLQFPSPEYIIYHLYMHVLQTRVDNSVSILRNGVCDTEFRNEEGIRGKAKMMKILDDAKKSVTFTEIADLFARFCKTHGLAFHNHMLQLINMLMVYGNITIGLLNEHSSKTHERALMHYIIRTFYEDSIQ